MIDAAITLNSPIGQRLKAAQEEEGGSIAVDDCVSLLKDVSPKDVFKDNKLLANNLKKLPIQLFKIRPLEESISTSGGLTFNNLDDSLMISSLPGFFAAGEMLDWEAPTGGYLLQGCFSTAYHVSESIFSYFTS